MKLRQHDNPADKASWDEHFYNGRLRVVNGIVETDDPVRIGLLQQRGFRIVPDVVPDVVPGAVPTAPAVLAEKTETKSRKKPGEAQAYA